MVSASLGDQLEGRAIVTLEAIGPEDIGILPGARTVRRVEVEQDAAPLRESHAFPAEIAPGLRHDCGEEGIKAADFLHELVGELTALSPRADGWDAVQRMCHDDDDSRPPHRRPAHINKQT